MCHASKVDQLGGECIGSAPALRCAATHSSNQRPHFNTSVHWPPHGFPHGGHGQADRWRRAAARGRVNPKKTTEALEDLPNHRQEPCCLSGNWQVCELEVVAEMTVFMNSRKSWTGSSSLRHQAFPHLLLPSLHARKLEDSRRPSHSTTSGPLVARSSKFSVRDWSRDDGPYLED